MGKKIKDKADSPELRPIGSRALKSCIDTLRPHLLGATILELFAGRARFSFEALLQGASSALLVEKNPQIARELKTKIPKKMPVEKRIEILCQDVWFFLKQPSPDRRFDIILADPPFPQWETLNQTEFFLLVAPFCKPSTIFLVKTPSRMLLSSVHPGFTLWKLTHFGESQFAYFLYE